MILLGPRNNYSRNRIITIDSDAQNYIDRVEAADGQSLEKLTKYAIHDLFTALKTIITWRGSSITLLSKLGYTLPLCGPRTLNGAMVPLTNLTNATPTGTSQMNWNRKTGLGVIGSDPGGVFVSIPYADNTDPQNDASIFIIVSGMPATVPNAVWLQCNGTGVRREMATTTTGGVDRGCLRNSTQNTTGASALNLAFKGATRIASSGYDFRVSNGNIPVTQTSSAATTSTFRLFRSTTGTGQMPAGARLNLAGLGRDTDLTRLQKAFETYIAAIASAF